VIETRPGVVRMPGWHRGGVGQFSPPPRRDHLRRTGAVTLSGDAAGRPFSSGGAPMPARRVSLVCGAHGAAAGHPGELEMRKNFTPSERIAIMDTISRKTVGRQWPSDYRPPVADKITAAKHSGFGSRQTAEKIAMPAVKAKTPIISRPVSEFGSTREEMAERIRDRSYCRCR